MQEFKWKLGLKHTLEACWQPWNQAYKHKGSSALVLERNSTRAQHYLRSSALPLGLSAHERTVHGRSPFHLGFGFESPTRTKRLTYIFLRVSRASRVLLIPINRPLNIEERHTPT
jgi:hypothetical protein